MTLQFKPVTPESCKPPPIYHNTTSPPTKSRNPLATFLSLTLSLSHSQNRPQTHSINLTHHLSSPTSIKSPSPHNQRNIPRETINLLTCLSDTGNQLVNLSSKGSLLPFTDSSFQDGKEYFLIHLPNCPFQQPLHVKPTHAAHRTSSRLAAEIAPIFCVWLAPFLYISKSEGIF